MDKRGDWQAELRLGVSLIDIRPPCPPCPSIPSSSHPLTHSFSAFYSRPQRLRLCKAPVGYMASGIRLPCSLVYPTPAHSGWGDGGGGFLGCFWPVPLVCLVR